LHNVRYSSRVSFTGRGGLAHHYDFLIPRSNKYPERLVQAITNPNRNAATSLAFSWVDTREARPENSQAFALLNDQDRNVPGETSDTLRSYGVEPVMWSNREQIASNLYN
jgi:hypothetical protein